MKDTHLRIGTVIKPHGLNGEVKVYPLTDDPGRFSLLKTVLCGTEDAFRELLVENVRYQKQLVILKFAECHGPEEAETYRGKDLFVCRKDAVPLKENEYFMADLLGMAVFSEEGKRLGHLAEIITTAANDVYVVKKANGGELLLPAVAACIVAVDIAAAKMTVHLLPGLG